MNKNRARVAKLWSRSETAVVWPQPSRSPETTDDRSITWYHGSYAAPLTPRAAISTTTLISLIATDGVRFESRLAAGESRAPSRTVDAHSCRHGANASH